MIDGPFWKEPNPNSPSGQAGDDLNIAVLQSLSRLTDGQPTEFSDHEWPSLEILDWVARAERPELHGLLIAALRRWHQLRRND